MATKENKRENLSVLAKVTQVSDVAHGLLVFNIPGNITHNSYKIIES
jgi:hypothetical protein